MIIDSHAHIDWDTLNHQEIVANMKNDRVEKIVSIGVSLENSKNILELAKKYKDVYIAVGIHPEEVNTAKDEDILELEKLAKHEKVVAIGEIGLDYHYTQDNIPVQKDYFVKQIKLAYKLGLPICVHTRDAKEDTYQILKEYKDYIVKPSIMHCYSYDGEYAKKFIDLGFYLSFAGNVTYKNSFNDFIKDIPLDKIVVETDCPFLSPVPFRGKINVPANAHYTAEKIADMFEMDAEEFKKHTIENTYRVYKKMKRD